MTGVSLAPACSPPSRERNQKTARTARTNTAVTMPVVVLDFNFRGGGAFSFDLFLDFLLIETIPVEPSFKSEPYSASQHSRHSQRFKRCARGQVLHAAYAKGDQLRVVNQPVIVRTLQRSGYRHVRHF